MIKNDEERLIKMFYEGVDKLNEELEWCNDMFNKCSDAQLKNLILDRISKIESLLLLYGKK